MSSCCGECLARCCKRCPCNCLLCCFGFLTLCGCRDRVCQKLVFFPPVPMYSIEAGDGERQVMWIVEEGKKVDPFSSHMFKIQYLKTSRRQTICAMHILCPKSPTTILYSHGNATDIGCMRDHLLDMSNQLGVSILAYDYSGYGLSTGQPTMKNTLADGEAVLNYLTSTPDFKESTKFVILYGQSLGSGITLHLAKKYKTKIAGVVVHSGLMSALRVIQDVPKTKWFDIYNNIDIVKDCTAPLFVIHGTEDVEVPVHHGQALTLAAANQYKPWFVEGAGHNNIEIHWREPLFKKLAQFIKDVEDGKVKVGAGTQAQDLDIRINVNNKKKSTVASSSSPKKNKYESEPFEGDKVHPSERELIVGHTHLRYSADTQDHSESTTPIGGQRSLVRGGGGGGDDSSHHRDPDGGTASIFASTESREFLGSDGHSGKEKLVNLGHSSDLESQNLN